VFVIDCCASKQFATEGSIEAPTNQAASPLLQRIHNTALQLSCQNSFVGAIAQFRCSSSRLMHAAETMLIVALSAAPRQGPANKP